MIDYGMVVILIAAPFILGFGDGSYSTWSPIVLAGIILFLSLCTAYELGWTRLIPMRTHLAIDFLGGAFLIASPWLLDFADRVYLPHVILGAAEVVVALVTKLQPGSGGRREVGYSAPMESPL
jgi:hypothetical protein